MSWAETNNSIYWRIIFRFFSINVLVFYHGASSVLVQTMHAEDNRTHKNTESFINVENVAENSFALSCKKPPSISSSHITFSQTHRHTHPTPQLTHAHMPGFKRPRSRDHIRSGGLLLGLPAFITATAPTIIIVIILEATHSPEVVLTKQPWGL